MAIATGTAILGAAAIGGAASMYAGSRQSRNARRGMEAQVEAGDRATQYQYRAHREVMDRLEPATQFAESAMDPLADLLGLDFQLANVKTGQQRGVQQPVGLNAWNASQFTEGDVDRRDMWENRGEWAPGQTGQPIRLQRQPNGSYRPVSAPMQTTNAPAMTAQPTQVDRGQNAYTALMNTPGYQHRFSEGQRMLDASAAARGMISSGDNIRGAVEYGQNFATNEFDNAVNRYLAVVNGGQVANSQANASTTNLGNNVARIAMDTGRARQSGYNAIGNAQANAWNGVAGAAGWATRQYGDYQGWWG